ncbi:MAG: hypothetical protein IPF83_11710 [Rhodanobacteraceae bacterium]|nr:hypothetical protein [Rhodanobacteraceae bacterium]MBK7044765.1 hypothetical protein [Rhodanobacteraceae bacterium]HQW82062.1 hypothetical protein [Pseudomonadota bacterium]
MNAALEHPTTYDKAYYEQGEKAKRLAAEINRMQQQLDPTEFRSANAL